MSPLARVLDRLPDAKRYGASYRVRCPAHDGRRPDTLKISERSDGAVMMRCFHGCETAAIVRHLGLDFADLFEKDDWTPHHKRPHASDEDRRYLQYRRAITREYGEQRTHERQIRTRAVSVVADLLCGGPVDLRGELEAFGCYAAIIEDCCLAERAGGPELVWGMLMDQFITLLNKAPLFMKALMEELRARCRYDAPQDDSWDGLVTFPLRPYTGYRGYRPRKAGGHHG